MRLAAAALISLSLAATPAFAVSYVHLHKAAKGKPVNTAPVKPPHLNYYGGRVISNVKIVAVYWGPKVDPSVTSQIPAFYADFVASPMLDWLSEYNTNLKAVDGSAGTNQTIGHGTYAQAVTITPHAKASILLDKQVQDELRAQIKGGALPAPDANTLYMVHFPPKQVLKLGRDLSCKAFCGYHSTFDQTTYYAVFPDQSQGSGCDVGCGSAGSFGNLTATASHEIVEAITDAQVGTVKGNAAVAPMAWYDPDKDATGHEYAEIGDICSSYSAPMKMQSGHTWTVQKMWSNKAQGCILQSGDAPQLIASAKTPAGGATGAKAKTKGKAVPAKATPKRRLIKD